MFPPSRLIEKSQALAKVEGINIPRTVKEYTKAIEKKLPIVPSGNAHDYLADDDDDEDDSDGEDDDPSIDGYSQSSFGSSRVRLITNSEMKIAIKSTTKSEFMHQNNSNSSGDYYASPPASYVIDFPEPLTFLSI